MFDCGGMVFSEEGFHAYFAVVGERNPSCIFVASEGVFRSLKRAA